MGDKKKDPGDLVLKNSKIEGAGKGLFAGKDYKKGEILGEYFGTRLINGEGKVPREKDAYIYTTDKNTIIVPDDGCLLQYVNDAIDLKATVEQVFSWFTKRKRRPTNKQLREAVDIEMDVEPFVTDGAKYNVDWKEKKDRVYLVTTQSVEKGEEFFIYYGKFYWGSYVYEEVRTLSFEKW